MSTRRRKGNVGGDDLDDYDSSFDEDDELEDSRFEKKSKRSDLTDKDPTPNIAPASSVKGLPTKAYFQNELTRAESYKNRYFALNAYERHRKLINEYFLYHPGAKEKVLKRDESKDRRDIDIIRENHRFLWNDDEDPTTWEQQLAKRYYDKLFKEYCICDLSRYKENKVAMRWRTESELVDGKGQFTCGTRKCSNNESLRTWEVNFAYMEETIKKNALVKLRLCPECSTKLNYGKKCREVTKKTKKKSKRVEDKRNRHKKLSSSSRMESDGSEPSSSTSNNVEQSEEATTKNPENIWKEPLAVPEMKSREEEFEEYLDDLFV